jgi:hypothetical protein
MAGISAEEKYNRMVQMQEWLDEEFPRGCHVSVVHRWSNGYHEPLFDLSTARPFVIDTREVGNGVELYQVAFDPIVEGDDPTLSDPPPVYWFTGFTGGEGALVEGVTIRQDDGEPWEEQMPGRKLTSLRVVRMIEGTGPNAIPASRREFLTQLYEPEYFPDGVKHKEAAS